MNKNRFLPQLIIIKNANNINMNSIQNSNITNDHLRGPDLKPF